MSENVNAFEIASRSKFRFPFKGMASVEDLWDLSLTNLDSVFKSLNSELKQVKEESLLETKSQEDQELDIKIEIVKYIVKTKQEEAKLKLQEKENNVLRQKLLEIKAKKQDASLENMSVEEIDAALSQLN